MFDVVFEVFVHFVDDHLSDWQTAKELYGCGKYADDAYRIFMRGEWESVEPTDHALNDYHNFLVQIHNR